MDALGGHLVEVQLAGVSLRCAPGSGEAVDGYEGDLVEVQQRLRSHPGGRIPSHCSVWLGDRPPLRRPRGGGKARSAVGGPANNMIRGFCP